MNLSKAAKIRIDYHKTHSKKNRVRQKTGLPVFDAVTMANHDQDLLAAG